MSISPQEVEHVAELARLAITSQEKTRYAKELSRILKYMERLNKVDTKKVKPTSQVTGLANVMAEDEVATFKNKKGLLKNVPEMEEGQVKVKGVFK